MTKFCRLLALNKQAYCQHSSHKEEITFEHELIIKQVQLIHQNHRNIGTRKLYEILQLFLIMYQIKMFKYNTRLNDGNIYKSKNNYVDKKIKPKRKYELDSIYIGKRIGILYIRIKEFYTGKYYESNNSGSP